MRNRYGPSAILTGILIGAISTQADETPADTPKVIVDIDGTLPLAAMSVPRSPSSSDEAKKNVLDFVYGLASLSEAAGRDDDINAFKKRLDDRLMRPGLEKLRAVFAVDIRPEMNY